MATKQDETGQCFYIRQDFSSGFDRHASMILSQNKYFLFSALWNLIDAQIVGF